MRAVTSLKDLTVAELAIEMCNQPNFKAELYDTLKQWKTTDNVNIEDCLTAVHSLFKQQPEIAKKPEGLPESLQEEVADLIDEVAAKILHWCWYHAAKFDLPNDYSIHFLNKSLFNSHGEINSEKAIEVIVEDETLSFNHRFKIACGYLTSNKIDVLWKQMTDDERKTFVSNDTVQEAQHSRLPELWGYYLTGNLEKSPLWQGDEGQPLEEAFWRHAYEQAVIDRNSLALGHAWEHLLISGRESFAVEMALKMFSKLTDMHDEYLDDNFFDILCFLLSNMTEELKKRFLMEDLREARHSIVLLFLVRDSYDQFLQTLALMWEFLPLTEYDYILSEAIYTANILFRDVWNQSPDHFKKYVLSKGELMLSTMMRGGDKFTETKFIMQILSRSERVSIVFSKFEVNNYDSGLFVIAFAAGYLDFAKWLATSCEMPEIELKKLLKKELDYFAYELNFKVVTKRQLVYEEIRSFRVEKVDWIKKRWKEVLCMLRSKQMLQKYDEFFLWCFVSQEEMTNYKKKLFQFMTFLDYYNITLGSLGFQVLDRISFPSIKHFVAFFDIKGPQRRDLDRRTLLKFLDSNFMANVFFYSTSSDWIQEYKDSIERIHKLLNWCLNDKEMAIEVRDKFSYICNDRGNQIGADIVVHDFELAFQNRLQEFGDIHEDVIQNVE